MGWAGCQHAADDGRRQPGEQERIQVAEGPGLGRPWSPSLAAPASEAGRGEARIGSRCAELRRHQPTPTHPANQPRSQQRGTHERGIGDGHSPADFSQVYFPAPMTSNPGRPHHEIKRVVNAGFYREPRAIFRPLTRANCGWSGRPRSSTAGAAGASASEPGPISRSRSRATPALMEHGSDGLSSAKSGGMVFPVPAKTAAGKNRHLCYDKHF